MSRTSPARVVILGAGFGGLHAAQALRRTAVQITVLDRTNHHLFQPLLYQVATATLAPSDIAVPIRWVLRRQRNVTVLATIGRAKAIADFGPVHLTGFVAWIVWLFVHILNLVGFRNRLSVLLQWAYAYFTYQRGMRLITEVDVEATRSRAGCASRPPIGPFTQRER